MNPKYVLRLWHNRRIFNLTNVAKSAKPSLFRILTPKNIKNYVCSHFICFSIS